VAGAGVSFPESGDDEPVIVDEAGQTTWNNLPVDGGTLNVSAQGYLSAQQSFSIERGPNEVTVTMQPDPYGLLPSAACAPGETPVYVEDFQDGVADGWPDIQFNAPGWALGPEPLDASDLSISASYSPNTGGGPISSQWQGATFENAAWRIRYLVNGQLTGQNGFSFNWLHAIQPIDVNGTEVFDSRYQFPLGSNNFGMRRLQQPVLNIGIGQGKYPKDGEWHYVEFGTYQGYTEVWVDGVQTMTYQDPQPLPEGTIGLEVWLFDDSVSVYFDDISICELSAPFVPISAPVLTE